jgi:hypothetical protein
MREGPIRLVPVASIAREMLDGRHAAEVIRRSEAARGTTNVIGIDRRGSRGKRSRGRVSRAGKTLETSMDRATAFMCSVLHSFRITSSQRRRPHHKLGNARSAAWPRQLHPNFHNVDDATRWRGAASELENGVTGVRLGCAP